ncbi:PAS domain S-box-containing protein [Sediminibacterium goheungense]|uniref:histidine kinase n=2 Tax=Sediminibacterium goheungense TaxID=1086393 RepID=A0A4R6J1E5_9BACT|nr:PAS domain S-box-containing protein [Sediminibacterium goheungense]
MMEHSELFACILLNEAGYYTYANQRFCRVTGWSPISLLETRADAYIHYADLDFFRHQLTNCRQNHGQKFSATVRYVHGHQTHTIQWELCCYANDLEEAIVGMGVLLSGEPLEEFAATKYAHQFNEYLDGVQDGFFALNRNWVFTRVNRFFEQVTNLSRHEMIGRSFWDIFPDSPDQPYAVAMRKAFDLGQTITFEQPWPPSYHFAVSASPSKEGIICYFIDISLQKKQQLELLANEIKLKAILDSTTDVNIMISPDMHILNFNRTAGILAEEYFQTKLYEGANFMNYVMPELRESFQDNFNRALSGEKLTMERPVSLPNGDAMWFQFLYYPVYSEAGDMLGVAMNITNINGRKTAEMKLLQQYDKMREIAYLQSHEARAPLSNILGLINVLMLYTEKTDDPEILQVLDHLHVSAARLDTVIQKIVSNTRHESD